MKSKILISLIFLYSGYHAQFSVQEYKNLIPEDSAHNFFSGISNKTKGDVKVFRHKEKNIYACWLATDSLFFQYSEDNGQNWLKNSKGVCKINNAKNYIINGTMYRGHACITCDTSSSSFKGRIYICWTDEKSGKTNKDVFLVYSDDAGKNWTEPILVTYHPNHKEQFVPNMLINPTNGRLYLSYFDKQNYPENNFTDVYLALSDNGGLKFDKYKINQKSISFGAIPLKNKLRYTEKGNVEVFWSQTNTQKKEIYYSTLINDSLLKTYNVNLNNNEISIGKTFSFSNNIKINFLLNREAIMSAIITKPLESGYEKIVFKNKKFNIGKNSFTINSTLLNLKNGNYILTLYYNNKNTFSWVLEN